MKNQRIISLSWIGFLALSIGLGGCSLLSMDKSGSDASAGRLTSFEQTTDWPKRSINVIVGFSAGGDTDYNARELAKYLSKSLGQSIVVTNVSGSGGSIAASQVKSARPNGYTVLFTHAALNIAEAVGTINFGFDDFEVCCMAGKAEGEAIIVRADAGWNSLEDMIEASKKNPGKYKLTASTGATTQWAAIALQEGGGKFNIVDAGNASDRIAVLLGGHVDVITNSIPTVKDYIDSGVFKVLATCMPERSKYYPNVPTLKERGIDCAYNNGYTIFFPKGTDHAIVNKMNQAVKDIVETNPEYAQAIKKAYLQDPYYLDTEDTLKYWSDERERLMTISNLLQGKK